MNIFLSDCCIASVVLKTTNEYTFYCCEKCKFECQIKRTNLENKIKRGKLLKKAHKDDLNAEV